MQNLELIQTVSDGDQPVNLGFFPAGTKIFIQRPKTYTIELTEKEAETLFALTNEVAGDPKRSARKYIDSIGNKLDDLNVKHTSLMVDTEYRGLFILTDV